MKISTILAIVPSLASAAIPSSIEWISIPGGEYTMGTDTTYPPKFDQGPAHQVTLPSYNISTTEVTNEQFTQFLQETYDAGALRVLNISASTPDEVYAKVGIGQRVALAVGGKWDGERMYVIDGEPNDGDPDINRSHIDFDEDTEQFSVDDEFAEWPVIYTPWYGAQGFADYYGLALPTEAMWEVAARGPDNKAQYASADGQLSLDEINYREDDEVGQMEPVKTYPASPFGIFEMSGNAFEWLGDWYDADYYSESPSDNPPGPDGNFPPHNASGDPRSPVDCVTVDPPCQKILRGGAYNYQSFASQTTYRQGLFPHVATDHMGFRVVSIEE